MRIDVSIGKGIGEGEGEQGKEGKRGKRGRRGERERGRLGDVEKLGASRRVTLSPPRPVPVPPRLRDRPVAASLLPVLYSLRFFGVGWTVAGALRNLKFQI